MQLFKSKKKSNQVGLISIHPTVRWILLAVSALTCTVLCNMQYFLIWGCKPRKGQLRLQMATHQNHQKATCLFVPKDICRRCWFEGKVQEEKLQESNIKTLKKKKSILEHSHTFSVWKIEKICITPEYEIVAINSEDYSSEHNLAAMITLSFSCIQNK